MSTPKGSASHPGQDRSNDLTGISLLHPNINLQKTSSRTTITNAYIAMLLKVPVETSYNGFRGSLSLVISLKSLNRMYRHC